MSILIRVVLNNFKTWFIERSRPIKEYKKTSGTESAAVLQEFCVKRCLLVSGWLFLKFFNVLPNFFFVALFLNPAKQSTICADAVA